ncbi:MAG: TetR/AcrR family transcriptional regulator [Polyangia bacterium]|nr:TetR/AcrR family transcriptional regulator [Polyangia bacterium]
MRHRQEILDASCVVFSEKGYRNTTIADISKRSEFSIASIYKHFESKEDIYHSLIEDYLEMYHSELEAVARNISSPLEQLRACITRTYDLLVEHRVFMEFFVGEWRPAADLETDELARKSMDAYSKLVMFMAERFERAAKLGEVVDDINPIYLAIGLLGQLFIFGSYWIYFEHVSLAEAPKELIPRIFFDRIALK